MMNEYEVRLADGRVVALSSTKGPEDACARAADLYGSPSVAWRHPAVWVGPVHHSQIIG